MSALAVVCLALLLLAGCGTAGSGGPGEISMNSGETPEIQTPVSISRSPTPEPTPTFTPEPTNTPIPYTDDWPADLATVADNLIDQEDGVFGVVILDAEGEVLYSRNSTIPFVTASLYKLVVMADILKRVERGEISLDQEILLEPALFQDGEDGDTYFTAADIGGTATVRDFLYYVGDYSSNVSARALLRFTDWQSLTETARQSGMTQTYFYVDPTTTSLWPPTPGADSSAGEAAVAESFVMDQFTSSGPVNLTTAMDMASYQLGLINGTVVSPYVSAQILSILRLQEIDDRIPVLLDSRFTVANKPGNLIHAVHDVGIIFTPGEPRVLAALSEGLIWDGRAHEVIQRLALIATGNRDVPPVSEAAMQDHGVVEVVFGPATDSREVIADPAQIVSPEATTEPSASTG
ncbi:MAG: serine hydrolase [Thermomicrobiales bacterium]|nr:serine hydrolase [Thermomicrobiales bacterium]